MVTNKLDLRFVGQLSDAELSIAYSGAQALLVPSKYEGFRLPVIEAMACGCPVIVEKSPAIFEIGADAVIFSDVSSPDGIDQAIRMARTPNLRQEITTKGMKRALIFDWSKSAGDIGQFVNSLSMKLSILLTAIVSNYNAAAFIHGCLEDLAHQTILDRLEIIVVDSASEQDEAAVVRAFQRR